MRTLTFLAGEYPLTKTFYADGKSDPYPLISQFTSFQVSYKDIHELKEALELTGSTGACMLKGSLSKQIVNESRVGLTDPSADTDLLVIDYDSDGGFSSVAEMLGEIDPLLADTDYIFQHSASSGIKGKTGIRGHAFLMLSENTSPILIKQWLKKVNLTSEKFRKRIRLSRNAMALCYALDITVNQNDKLIYIAAPKLIGIEDPIEERFSLHIGEQRTYTFNTAVSAASNRNKEHQLIEDLQDTAGLTKRTPRYKVTGDYEILTNPSSCVVSNSKDCGKFVRINLNGGDSFAYWYAKDNPEILHNFKGEPAVYLKDIAPEYYEQLQRQAKSAHLRPFVFRDIQSNIYYNAEYNEETKLLGICYPTSRPAIADFMTQRGAPPPKTVPDWVVEFDPTADKAVDFTTHHLNLFRPTKYLNDSLTPPSADTEGHFPIIERVLRHICVNEETYNHFIAWVAHIVQYRTKTQTAWVFQGEEGTGKGTLFHKILTPILGPDHTFLITQDQADEQYNGYLMSNMLLFLDEGDSESSRSADRMLAKFRSLITEPIIPIRQMRANVIRMANYTNLIIATNKYVPVKLTAGDRRYNVAPRQNSKLQINAKEYARIEGELTAFTQYLKAQQIAIDDSIKVLESEARKQLQTLSQTVADNFFVALKEGDLDFFADALLETVPLNNPGYINYAKIINKWMASVGTKTKIDMKEVITVYQYLSGNEDITDKRFGHLASRHDLPSERLRINGVLRRVITCNFIDRGYEDWINRNPRQNVVQIKGK